MDDYSFNKSTARFCLLDNEEIVAGGIIDLRNYPDQREKKEDFRKNIIPENYNLNDNSLAAIIIPDKDIIPGAKNLKPAYIVFDNYELILKWNRSLRFALAVCTLKEKFENEI